MAGRSGKLSASTSSRTKPSKDATASPTQQSGAASEAGTNSSTDSAAAQSTESGIALPSAAPAALPTLADATFVVTAESAKSILQYTFVQFLTEAWQILEPVTERQWNWHLDLICEYLTLIQKEDFKTAAFKARLRSWRTCRARWRWQSFQSKSLRRLEASFHHEDTEARRKAVLPQIHGKPGPVNADQRRFVLGGCTRTLSVKSARLPAITKPQMLRGYSDPSLRSGFQK